MKRRLRLVLASIPGISIPQAKKYASNRGTVSELHQPKATSSESTIIELPVHLDGQCDLLVT
jgi:hypothetical protein